MSSNSNNLKPGGNLAAQPSPTKSSLAGISKLQSTNRNSAFNSASSDSKQKGKMNSEKHISFDSDLNLKINAYSQEPTTPIDKLNTPRTVTVPHTAFFQFDNELPIIAGSFGLNILFKFHLKSFLSRN